MTESIVRQRLSNGMTVIVRENPAAPVVAMTLLIDVGVRNETAVTNGVTALLGRVLTKGTRVRSALELAQAVEETGGALESGADQEYAELRVRGLARHWRALLGLLGEVATAPSFPPEEIEREREVLLARIRGLEDEPFQVASRLLSRALYGDHPYGLPPSGDISSVHSLTRAQLVNHFETFYAPDRMVLTVSGEVDASALLAEVARTFGGAARAVDGAPLPSPPERPAAWSASERRPTQQAQLLLGFLAPPVGHPDHVSLKVLNTVLGGGISSRLFRSLRDEAGLAYAVGSFYPTRRETSRLVVHIGTAPEKLPRARAGIRQELQRLGEVLVPDDELAGAKAFLTGSFALDLRTNARQSFYLGSFELMGLGPGHVSRYPAQIGAVGSQDVLRVARRYLREPSVVIVGPEPG